MNQDENQQNKTDNPEGAKPEEAAAEGRTAAPAEGDQAAAQPADQSAEIAALKDRLLRTLAEMENLRKRAEREREDAAKYAISSFARDLLGVADNLRRALESLPDAARNDENVKVFVDGMELIERELLKAFEKAGIRRIDPLGEKFDHNLHEALFEVPSADQPSGVVIQVIQPGYVINDRLLRAARVGVTRAIQPESENRVDTSA
ncbi:MAG TPA: nucleotide exchange factor GrpE [Sphingomonadales bacterium]